MVKINICVTTQTSEIDETGMNLFNRDNNKLVWSDFASNF